MTPRYHISWLSLGVNVNSDYECPELLQPKAETDRMKMDIYIYLENTQ